MEIIYSYNIEFKTSRHSSHVLSLQVQYFDKEERPGNIGGIGGIGGIGCIGDLITGNGGLFGTIEWGGRVPHLG